MSSEQHQRNKNTGSQQHVVKHIIEEDEQPAQQIILPLQNPNSQGFETKDEIRNKLKNSMSLRSHQGAVNMIDSDDLEIKLQNAIEKIKTAYFTICKQLMKLYICIMIPQIGLALYQLIDCGCFESEANNLICIIHFLKIAFNIFNTRRYLMNIRDYQCHHPVGSLNTFLMITFYYGMLFVYIDLLKENIRCIYLIGIYPLTDFTAVFYSLYKIRRIVMLKQSLETKPEYKDYQGQINTKLREVLYLPVAFESDVEEDHDD